MVRYLQNICTSNGTLSNSSISIVISNTDLNISSLPSNISIIFNDDTNNYDDDNIQCVWLDENTNIWKSDGCETRISSDNSNIQCICNDLTTFATIHNIINNNNDESECDLFFAEIINSEWDYLHLSFIIVFFCILMYSIIILIPFFRFKQFKPRKYTALSALLLVAIISLINIAMCVYFATITLSHIDKNHVGQIFPLYIAPILAPNIAPILPINIFQYNVYR